MYQTCLMLDPMNMIYTQHIPSWQTIRNPSTINLERQQFAVKWSEQKTFFPFSVGFIKNSRVLTARQGRNKDNTKAQEAYRYSIHHETTDGRITTIDETITQLIRVRPRTVYTTNRVLRYTYAHSTDINDDKFQLYSPRGKKYGRRVVMY